MWRRNPADAGASSRLRGELTGWAEEWPAHTTPDARRPARYAPVIGSPAPDRAGFGDMDDRDAMTGSAGNRDPAGAPRWPDPGQPSAWASIGGTCCGGAGRSGIGALAGTAYAENSVNDRSFLAFSIQPCWQRPGALTALDDSHNLFSSKNRRDRWQSGRMRALGKRVTGQLVRGFESLPVRQVS